MKKPSHWMSQKKRFVLFPSKSSSTKSFFGLSHRWTFDIYHMDMWNIPCCCWVIPFLLFTIVRTLQGAPITPSMHMFPSMKILIILLHQLVAYFFFCHIITCNDECWVTSYWDDMFDWFFCSLWLLWPWMVTLAIYYLC